MNTLYIYQAELWCEECGEKLAKSLPKPDYGPPWDSNDYPAATSAGETDCPNHCPGCGVLLYEALTSEAAEYICRRIRFYLETEHGNLDALTDWADYLSWNADLTDEQDQLLAAFFQRLGEEYA